MTNFPKDPKEFFEQVQEYMPKVSVQKSGYEVRLKILELAQAQAFQPMAFQMQAYGGTASTEWEADKIVAKVQFPDYTEVLDIAEKFNAFVNKK